MLYLESMRSPRASLSQVFENEGGAGGVDQVVAVFVFFGDFLVGLALGLAVAHGKGQSGDQLLEGGTIGGRVGGGAVGSHLDVVNPGSGRG